jgi:hypothetical protein
LSIAKRDYREAYDTGDTDKIIEAQTRMNDAQYKLSHAQNLKPQYNTYKRNKTVYSTLKNKINPRLQNQMLKLKLGRLKTNGLEKMRK